jgi:DNA-binding CsgD family transcriptional regulator
LFGREAERTRIKGLLARAEDGPVGIAIEGSAGIGKTTVWRDALAGARRCGYRVLVAAPSEADAALAFSGLGDLLDGLSVDVLNRLPDPQRRALSAALFLSDASEAPESLDALPRAVLSVLRDLAADLTVVVAIDDEQWLDRASARVLAFALDRVREERVCLLLSRRARSEGPLWTEARDRFAPGVEVVELAGVDMETTQRLLATVLESKIPRRVLRRVHEISGGNPLYVLALGAELEHTGASTNDWRGLRIPTTLTEAITQRLERARPGAEAPLFAVAALADPTLSVLTAALDGFEVDDLGHAVTAGVIEIAGERVRFTHPLLASVHYASVPARERHELHLRLARAVADAEERALHLALGTAEPDERVARELEHAAELAARRGAPEAAAELLEHASRLTSPSEDARRQSRTVTAAEQHYLAGDSERVRELLERLLLEQPGGPISARARLRLALVRTDDFEFGAAMLDQAIVEAGDDDRLRAQIEVVRVDLAANVGDYGGKVRHGEAAVASAERLGEPGLLASALAALGEGLFYGGQGLRRDLFERAIELERSTTEAGPTYYLPSTTYGTLLRLENDLDGARPLLERALARARRRGEEGADLIPLLVRLARLESDAGNPAASDRWLAQAAEAARQHVNDEMDCWLAHVEGEIAASRGQLDRARVRADEAMRLAVASGDAQMQRDSDVLLANIELLGGESDLAHQRLRPRREWAIAHGPWYLGWHTLPLWSSDIEALIGLDRGDDAQRVLDDLLERALAYPNPHALAITKRCEGLVLSARGELATAIDSFDMALAEHGRRLLPLELGRTLLEKGSIERRAKRKSAAKNTLERALVVLETADAAIWAARARDELGRIGLRRPAIAQGLTPAQKRVAELAAAGATNREIAQTLYMSRRTVESHLTMIYRQLGVRSRAELAAAHAATTDTDDPDTIGPLATG